MAAAFFAAMSCNVFDDAEYADIRELAPSQGEILIPKEGGKADINQGSGFVVKFVVGAVRRNDRKGVPAEGIFLRADFACAGAGAVGDHLPALMAVF